MFIRYSFQGHTSKEYPLDMNTLRAITRSIMLVNKWQDEEEDDYVSRIPIVFTFRLDDEVINIRERINPLLNRRAHTVHNLLRRVMMDALMEFKHRKGIL